MIRQTEKVHNIERYIAMKKKLDEQKERQQDRLGVTTIYRNDK